MMGLEAKEVKKVAEEVGCGEGESTLKVSNENHPLTGLRGGGLLISGTSDDHRGVDPA